MIRYHDAFTRAVPLYASEPRGALSLYSIKVEELEIGFSTERFYDLVALDGEAIYSIPFVRRDEAGYVFNERLRCLGTHALAQAQAWLVDAETRFASKTAPWIQGFIADAEIDRVREQSHSVRMPVIPGLSTAARLFLELDRYAFAAALVSGRDALDLRAGSGFGLQSLGNLATSVQAVYETPHAREIAQRMAVPLAPAPLTDADVVLAFGVESGAFAATLETARAKCRTGGSVVISTLGDEGRESIEAAGLRARRLVTPAYPANYAEWTAVENGAARAFPVPERKNHVPASCSAAPLSIAFLLRPSSKHVFGGDVVQVRKNAQALRDRGHRVEVFDDPRPVVDSFDVVNASGITNGAETVEQLEAIGSFSGPIVLMSIFTDHADEAVWGMRTAMLPFQVEKSNEGLLDKLRLLAQRRLTIPGHLLPPHRNDMMPGYTQEQVAILRSVDFIIANAQSEIHRIKRYLLPDIPFAIAPSCVDEDIYGAYQRERFIQRYNLSDFVLMAGRFEPRKNQLLFFEAVRSMQDRQIVCIGRNYEREYGSLCRAFWPPNAVIFSEMPEEELAGAFAAARVVVIPSWDEVVSLSSLNAAICEASLVLSRNTYEHEYLRDDAEYCDPGDYRSIASAIDRAWAMHDGRTLRRRSLAARIRSEYTWDRAAEITEAAYYGLLKYNPRGAQRLGGQAAASYPRS